MQPSIDTILICEGIYALFQSHRNIRINRALDIGSGSGFIGKFVAAHAPGEKPLAVELVDVDKTALEYAQSAEFNALHHGKNGRDISWKFHVGCAAKLLDGVQGKGYDLLVSNPSYVPTPDEVAGGAALNSGANFWEGTGLLMHLLSLVIDGRPATAPGSHLVLGFTSLTLKSKLVCTLLEEAERKGVSVQILREKEVGYKVWYAGDGVRHLLASPSETLCKQKIGSCEYFVGCTKNSQPRFATSLQHQMSGYHWHVAYIIHVHKENSGSR